MSNKPKLTVLIVNYNGMRFLQECIDSIRDHFTCSYEIIIVDNHSADESVAFIRASFPDVNLIVSDQNLGFTGGNNLGAQSARGEYLLLLNNDTKVLTDINPILSAFDSEPSLGVAGCRMTYGDGRLQRTMGYEHTPLRIFCSWIGLKRFSWLPNIFRREVWEPSAYESRQDKLAWVSGAFLVIRTSLWNQIGGFNDDYFMYMEDVELGKSASLAGYNIAYFPNVRILHYEGSGKAWIGESALKRSLRSYTLYADKFYSSWKALPLRFGLSCIMLYRSATYFLLSLFKRSDVLIDKRRSYFRAAIATMKNRYE